MTATGPAAPATSTARVHRAATWLRHLPSSGWKFAVFAAVCLVMLVGLAARVGNFSLLTSRHTVYAQLPDVLGLNSGDAVKIAGVTVGQVGSITLQRGHALVALDVNNNVEVRRGTEVSLHWKNVLGQKEIYLYPSHTGPVIRPGGTIPLADSVGEASVNALLSSLGPFLSAINPAEANAFVETVATTIESDAAQIDQLLRSGAVLSQTVGSLDTEVGSVIDNLDQVLTAFASHRSDLGSLISNLNVVATSLASHNNLLDGVVVNLSRVAGEFASLVGTNRSDLNSSIANLDTVAQTIVANQQSLEKGLATLGAGLAPYTLISSYGQWFQIQLVYSCLAGEAGCSYYQPGSPPAGSGPAGSPPSSPPSPSMFPAGAPSPGPGPSPNIGSMFKAVSGGSAS